MPCIAKSRSRTEARGRGRRSGVAGLAVLALVAATLPLGATVQAAGGTGTYAAWTAPSGTPPTTSGSFASTLFPNISAAAQAGNGTTSRDATISVASSATLSSNTPFGARFGSSLRQQYLNIGGPNSSGITAQVVLTFASAAPAGRWAFALGDVDAESVTISATGPGGALTASQLGWQGAFNYANKGILPSWNPATFTLTGSGNNTDGETGWFAPTADVTSITLTQTSITGFPSYQLWIATDDTPTTPLCSSGPQPDGSEVVCFLSGTSNWTVPVGVTNIEYLVVGGGGGGGADNGGGGGAGGMLTGSATVTPGTSLGITVGTGGAAGTGVHPNSTAGGDGSDSSLNLGPQTVLAKGGGGGGAGQVTNTGIDLNPGRPGGSGGGGAGERAAVTPGGTGIAGQGNNGGPGASTGGGGGGGGGGAGAVGASGSGKAGGNGGAGRSSAITGRELVFAGGGGGAGDLNTDPQGTGGAGGGGAAGNPAVAGAVNTGGGGGGGSYNLSTANGAAGGSGIVVIRYIITPYVVAYNANGGTGAPSSTSAYAGDTFTVSLTQPTRTGYTFAGWNTAANGSGTPRASGSTFIMPGSDVTLFAQWTAINLTLSYDANGGTGAPGSAAVAYGATATVSTTIPTRTGFWLNGWNTQPGGGGTAYASGSTFTMVGDITLYAQWVANVYRLVYSANGGTNAPAEQVLATDSTVNVAPAGATARIGYTFDTAKSWNEAFSGDGIQRAPGSTFPMPASNTTLFAQWTPIGYTLSYNANGGTGAPAAQPAIYLQSLTIGAAPTRQGYVFIGWNTAADGSGNKYAVGGSYLLTEAANVTLFAQWAPQTFVLSYDNNGGINGPGSSSVETGTSVTLASTQPSRTGFTFGGWNTAANGSGATYPAGSSFTMPGTNVTLFARWLSPSGPGQSPEPTPEPTPTPAPAPTPTVDEPFVNELILNLPAGQAVVFEGSQQVPVQVVSNIPNNTQTIQGQNWSLDLVALQPNGRPAPLTPSGAVDATAGGSVEVSGSGFAPGTVVKVYLIDPAQPLGTFTVGPDGTFTGKVPIPAGLTPGRYVIQANGTTPNGVVRSTSVGILIGGSQVAQRVKLKTTVYFEARSAVLDKKAKRKIARLAARVPNDGVVVRIRSVGFVQPESFTANDQRLSTKRARNVVRQLRKDGVRGPTVIRGNGQAKESGAKARRATVVVTYQISR